MKYDSQTMKCAIELIQLNNAREDIAAKDGERELFVESTGSTLTQFVVAVIVVQASYKRMVVVRQEKDIPIITPSSQRRS